MGEIYYGFNKLDDVILGVYGGVVISHKHPILLGNAMQQPNEYGTKVTGLCDKI